MKLKKLLAIVLAAVMCLGLLSACGTPAPSKTPDPGDTGSNTPEPPAAPVTISVLTTYAGEDTNATKFQQGVAEWETSTGNKVQDRSATSDETFKSSVLADFEMGSEPDVLFFFNGKDSDPFVSADKVVSIEEIREVYPDYASNMKDDMMGASPYDGKNYSVPVNGFWEGMFYNKEILEAAGVEVPTIDTTWEQFLADCQKIADAGYTPIAASLGHVPHYWFEFCIYNHLSPATHNVLPAIPTKDGDDWKFDTNNAQYKAWVAGLEDIKTLYEKDFFPANTLSATDDEVTTMFTDGKCAFLIQGSWQVGGIENACGADAENGVAADPELLGNFSVTYVGGMGDRKAGDIITGLSSGYYITRACWDDAAKREAAVSFISHMTSDEMVTKFAGATTTALKNGVDLTGVELSSLALAGMEMVKNATGAAGAVQDQVSDAARVPMFVPGMAEIVSGAVTAEEAVQASLIIIAEEG